MSSRYTQARIRGDQTIKNSEVRNREHTSVLVEVTVEVDTTVLTGQQLIDGEGVEETTLVTTDELLRAGQSVIEEAQDVTVYH